MPRLLLALVGVLTLASIIVSVNTDKAARVSTTIHHRSNPGNPFGSPEYGFGGYSVSKLTTEIGAQWRVPALDPRSSNGSASTWIAVQNDDRQFIQLGTTENMANGLALYGIFWSDVTVGFHPQQLLYVRAGDTIKFKMVQTSRGWRLSFDDVSDNSPETITVPYARGASFFSAEWLQEDPTVGGSAAHLPYPTIAPTTISHMTVNGAAPKLRKRDGQVLSTADAVYLIPTHTTMDQFTFTNAAGPTRQYLSDVFAYSVALYPFQADEFYNRAPSESVVHHLVTSLATLQSKLESQKWPTNMAGAAARDGKSLATIENLFSNFPESPARMNADDLLQLQAALERQSHFSETLSDDLGLPSYQ